MEEKELGMAWYKFLRYWMFGITIIFNLLSYWAEYAEYGSFADTLAIVIFWIIVVVETGLKITIHFHLKNYSKHVNRQLIIFAAVFLIISLIFDDGIGFLAEVTATLIIFWPTVIYFRKRSHIFVNECNFWGKKIGSPVQVCPDYTADQPKYKFCRICGEKLLMEDKFCSKCGTEVIEMEED